MMMKPFVLAATLGASLFLVGCATSNPDMIQRSEAQRLSQVQEAVVVSIRPVTVDGQQSGVGSVAGGVIGAVAGSSVGGRREGAVVGVLGAVAGGMLGNAIERQATREEAVELLLELRNGERRALVQSQGSERLQAGDTVLIITTGGKTRVSRAPNAQTTPQQPVPAQVR